MERITDFLTEEVLSGSGVVIDRREALRYLGYRKTAVDAASDSIMDEVLKETAAAAEYRCAFKEYDLSIDRESGTVSFGGVSVESANLTANLRRSERCVLIAFTAGAKIDRLIRRSEAASMARAAFFQAAGAAAVEAYADSVNEALSRIAASKGCRLRPRYSPGYGDLPLTFQREVDRLLNLRVACGIALTEQCIMVPSKSVTAIIGVESAEASAFSEKESCRESGLEKSGCGVCSMSGSCAYSRKE